MSHEKNEEMIRTLRECVTMCEHCYSACLDEADVRKMVNCIRMDRDCSDICNLTATLLSRDSQHAHHLMQECAEICEACAEECEKFPNLQHCMECAEACRRCAEACRMHSGAPVH